MYVKASHSSNLFCTKKSQYLISCEQVGPCLRPASHIYGMFCPSLRLLGYLVCIKHQQKTTALRRSSFTSLHFPPTAPRVTAVQNRLSFFTASQLQRPGPTVSAVRRRAKNRISFSEMFEKSDINIWTRMKINNKTWMMHCSSVQTCALTWRKKRKKKKPSFKERLLSGWILILKSFSCLPAGLGCNFPIFLRITALRTESGATILQTTRLFHGLRWGVAKKRQRTQFSELSQHLLRWSRPTEERLTSAFAILLILVLLPHQNQKAKVVNEEKT